jgi:hypothetical protein
MDTWSIRTTKPIKANKSQLKPIQSQFKANQSQSKPIQTQTNPISPGQSSRKNIFITGKHGPAGQPLRSLRPSRSRYTPGLTLQRMSSAPWQINSFAWSGVTDERKCCSTRCICPGQQYVKYTSASRQISK